MKVKLNNWLLLGSLCLAGAANAEPMAEKPQDFAYGISLTTEGRAPFFRIELPEAVYTESVWPDMRDVRVFNYQGQAVPFALTANVTTQENSQTFPLRLFPMKGKRVTDQEQQIISLKSAGGVEVTMPLYNDKPMGSTYLLEVPRHEGGYPHLTQLKLAWERLPENWQTRVNVFYSSDLKDWSRSAVDVPLMDLLSGSDRLLLDTIDLEGYDNPRYLLLVFKETKDVPNLKIQSAQGIVTSSHTEQQRINLPLEQKAISASEAEYTWSKPQPLDNISIRPTQGNTVLPLEIEYRGAASEGWLPLAKQVVYSINGRTAEAIPLKGLLVQGLRLKGINQQWGDSLPEVKAERDRQTLIFNAQGTSPFLLTWGNKAARPQAIPLDGLIPAELRKAVDADALPEAGLQSQVTLGGTERLSAVDATEEASMWKKGLLWLLLVLGAGGLVVLALKLWKEVQQKPQ
ncbi:DUF3999 family protein [Serratia silvae]|uniref:DUF3999 domain-containing protein n=1 Tax=Serratia silvae TaxID=2824122 RepID=A0ABT0KBE0_9GAMM|nr:DUF3999 family protein [Serratia silvae]MCL1029343.1 DUF3999 domain-containing protein [Serratia silvae]